MKPLLLFTGPVTTRSGYGAHSRDLVKSLIKMDKFDIKINSLRWGNTPWNALNLENDEYNLNTEESDYKNLITRLKQIKTSIALLKKQYLNKF